MKYSIILVVFLVFSLAIFGTIDAQNKKGGKKGGNKGGKQGGGRGGNRGSASGPEPVRAGPGAGGPSSGVSSKEGKSGQ